MSAPHTQHGLQADARTAPGAPTGTAGNVHVADAQRALHAVRQDARLSDVPPFKLALLIVATIVGTVAINHLAVLLSSGY